MVQLSKGEYQLSIKESVSLVAGSPYAAVESRILLGWLSEAEGVAALLGRLPAQNEDTSKQLASYKKAKDIVSKKSAHKTQDPIVKSNHGFDIPAILQNPMLETHHQGLDWSIEVVDLSKILSFQKAIKTEGLEERLQPIVDSPDDKTLLADFALPSSYPEAPQAFIPDSDKHGYSISSLNPNLRYVGAQVGRAGFTTPQGVPLPNMMGVTFVLSMNPSFMQAASYNGRVFLRDGYHRAVGLLRKGIKQLPVVYIKAKTFEEVVPEPQTMLSHEILYGDRPPTLLDFLNDEVSANIEQPSLRHVIHLKADEFNVEG